MQFRPLVLLPALLSFSISFSVFSCWLRLLLNELDLDGSREEDDVELKEEE